MAWWIYLVLTVAVLWTIALLIMTFSDMGKTIWATAKRETESMTGMKIDPEETTEERKGGERE